MSFDSSRYHCSHLLRHWPNLCELGICFLCRVQSLLPSTKTFPEFFFPYLPETLGFVSPANSLAKHVAACSHRMFTSNGD